SCLIDTGHTGHWSTLEPDVEQFLRGRPLDYVFVTHAEFAHGGALPLWMAKYPEAVCVGPMDNYHLCYPEFADRVRTVAAGDHLDLGDRRLVFIPAIWRDLPRSLWGFDATDRTLFVSDAFACL